MVAAPTTTAIRIAAWTRSNNGARHDLPYFDEQLHFPDLRIEYEELDGRIRQEDVEVLTVHYRGAHGAAAGRSGSRRIAVQCATGWPERWRRSRGGAGFAEEMLG